MTAQRIHSEFVEVYNDKFTPDLANEFMRFHREHCHHWDFTFLIWHRKMMNRFWKAIGLPRTYAVLTEFDDRVLYAQLQGTTLMRADGSTFFASDPQKLNSLTKDDLLQMQLDIAEGMACSAFAIDLDFSGRNRDRNGRFYNLSFSSQVEQYHDMVHGETGRGMRNVATAGGDACFYLHHTFVDLIFETWLELHPEAALPIDQAMFNNSSVLQSDYRSLEELEALWADRYYSADDYKHVLRISQPLVRQAVAFDEIEHNAGYRRVIMSHRLHGEIGRFAVFTGELATCAGCARKRVHSSQFLLRHLVPVNEITWNINNRPYLDFEDAVAAFERIGMSRPYVVSF